MTQFELVKIVFGTLEKAVKTMVNHIGKDFNL